MQGEDTLEPTRYLVKGRTYRTYPEADPGLQDALAQVYGSPERPRCLCVSGGIEMYIARHADYIVKRMPDTGHLHHPTCPSFEPEPGMSGLGELIGDAIIEHTPDQVEVRTDFAMSRLPGKAVPRGEAVIDPAEVNAPRKRMSLRALLPASCPPAGCTHSPSQPPLCSGVPSGQGPVRAHHPCLPASTEATG